MSEIGCRCSAVVGRKENLLTEPGKEVLRFSEGTNEITMVGDGWNANARFWVDRRTEINDL